MSWSKTKPHYYKWIIPTTHQVDESDVSKGVYKRMNKIEKKAFNTYYKALDALGIHYENMCQAQVVRVSIPKINATVEASVVDIKANKQILMWGKELKAYLPLDKWTPVDNTPADWKEQLRAIKPPVKKSKKSKKFDPYAAGKGQRYTEEGLRMIEEQRQNRLAMNNVSAVEVDPKTES